MRPLSAQTVWKRNDRLSGRYPQLVSKDVEVSVNTICDRHQVPAGDMKFARMFSPRKLACIRRTKDARGLME
jgi:hypothetical protein